MKLSAFGHPHIYHERHSSSEILGNWRCEFVHHPAHTLYTEIAESLRTPTL